MEDGGAESNVDYDVLAQEVSKEKDISKWPRDCSCEISVKNMAAFYPYPKVCLRLNERVLD